MYITVYYFIICLQLNIVVIYISLPFLCYIMNSWDYEDADVVAAAADDDTYVEYNYDYDTIALILLN